MRLSLIVLALMLSTTAFAATPSNKKVVAVVQKKLLKPLKKVEKKRSRFSRAMPTPAERKVRVLDAKALKDQNGKWFVRFAVDERFPWMDKDKWNEDRIIGCVYTGKKSNVFVQTGKTFRPAKTMLGKRAKPNNVVCRAVSNDAPDGAPATVAQAVVPGS